MNTWPAADGSSALVVVGRVTSAEGPEKTATAYGEYIMQRVRVEHATTILHSNGLAADEYERRTRRTLLVMAGTRTERSH